ncbi:MAG: hypothetical protein H0X13_15565 [Ramlibacter sp.]|nr:hypothetical protein [Ramlibacter sp.]
MSPEQLKEAMEAHPPEDEEKDREEAFYALADRRGWDVTAVKGDDPFDEAATNEHWQAWLAGIEWLRARHLAAAAPPALSSEASAVLPPQQ